LIQSFAGFILNENPCKLCTPGAFPYLEIVIPYLEIVVKFISSRRTNFVVHARHIKGHITRKARKARKARSAQIGFAQIVANFGAQNPECQY